MDANDSALPNAEALLRQAGAGDKAALAALFELHRKRLRGMVRLRLDRRLQGRVNPSDVLQEAFLDLAEKMPAYASNSTGLPFYLWLRMVVGERLLRVHRQHLGSAMRDAGREVSLYQAHCHRPAAFRWPHSSSAG